MGCPLLPTEYLVISYVVILLHKEKASKKCLHKTSGLFLECSVWKLCSVVKNARNACMAD